MKSKPKEEKWMELPNAPKVPDMLWLIPKKDGPKKALVMVRCYILKDEINVYVRRTCKCHYVEALTTKPDVSVAEAEIERRKYFGFRFKNELKLLE